MPHVSVCREPRNNAVHMYVIGVRLVGAALTLVRHGVLAEAGEEGTLGTVALAGCEAGDNRRHQHPQRPLYHTPARMQAVRAGRAVAHASHSHWHKHATTTTQVPTRKANPTLADTGTATAHSHAPSVCTCTHQNDASRRQEPRRGNGVSNDDKHGDHKAV